MKVEAAILASTLALTTFGCGQEDSAQKQPEAPKSTKLHNGKQLNPYLKYFGVQNITDSDIPISDNPDNYSPETEVGIIRPGVTILAFCVEYDAEHPSNTTVGVVETDADGNYKSSGYVGVYREYTKKTGGQKQLSVDPATLRQHLPDCPS